LFFYFK